MSEIKSQSFDDDIARITRIRIGTTHPDGVFLLGFIDRLWTEYSRRGDEIERRGAAFDSSIAQREICVSENEQLRAALRAMCEVQGVLELNHDILTGSDAIAARKEWTAANLMAAKCLAGETGVKP